MTCEIVICALIVRFYFISVVVSESKENKQLIPQWLRRLMLLTGITLWFTACGVPASQNSTTSTQVAVETQGQATATIQQATPTPVSTDTPQLTPTAAPTATQAPTNTPAPTATQAPTNTSAPSPITEAASANIDPVPLTAEGLTPLLFQPGDMPANWTSGDLYEEAPVDYEGPEPEVVLNLDFHEDGGQYASGEVILYVFTNETDARTAYRERAILTEEMTAYGSTLRYPPIGDQVILAPGNESVVVNDMTFLRCNAVAEIDLGLETELDLILNYASRLNERLEPSVCG